MAGIEILAIILIIVVAIIYAFMLYAVSKVANKGAINWAAICVMALIGLLFILYLSFNLESINPADWAQIILMFGLVAVTGMYAWSTRQMAEEMKEQKIIESRPVIIQKVETIEVIPSERSTDYFEIYNAGNGPAIEVEISLVLQRKPPYQPHNSQREGFLRAGDTPIKFHTTFPPDVANSTFYIVSEYQGISSYSTQPKWYQTWLPCKLNISGRVISGKLEFDEVSEKNRICIFNSELKNGTKK